MNRNKEIDNSKKELMTKTAKGIAENLKKLVEPDRNLVVSFPKAKMPTPSFIMLFQAVALMSIKSIDKNAVTVLYLFLTKMEYSNHIGMNIETISEELKISKRNVERALKQLKGKNIVLQYPDLQDKRRKIYMINPHLAWKGTFTNRKKVMKEMDKNQLSLDLPFAPNLNDKGISVISNKKDWDKEAEKFISNNANTNKSLNTNGKTDV